MEYTLFVVQVLGNTVKMACVIALSPETCDIALSRLPDDVEMTMRVLIEASANARIEYADFLRKKMSLRVLNENDYRLVSCCMRNYTSEKTAEVLGLSRSGTNRRLAILYKKLGVSSMKEMKTACLRSILDWRA